ncbi:hypothetical protein BH10ACI1_BH10ACI1_32270 [soil metagenome]
MSLNLRIILDKSVVFGLSKAEVDSLDRYFFQIVPPILSNEILADLSKEMNESSIVDKIAVHTYKISGNRGLTLKFQNILDNSLMGYEIPMEGKFLPTGEKMVRSDSGSIATIVETVLEDETISRWERKDFSEAEKSWAKKWRIKAERRIDPKIYTDQISKAGLNFKIPNDDSELSEIVESLLHHRKFQGKLLVLLAKEFNIPFEFQKQVVNRWVKERKPMIKDFAPYAFFCAHANLLWAIGLTNSELFKPNKKDRKNDRKDLEYCYYLPHCEIFTSKDKSHKMLIPYLLKPNQSFVDGEELKNDLRNLSEYWDKLSQEEKISYHQARGFAPPENENSVVFQLWKKHVGKISQPFPLEMLKMKLVDSKLPEEEQVAITFEEFLHSKMQEVNESKNMTSEEISNLRNIHWENNPATILQRTTKVSKERLLKLYPHLKETDLDNH